jgi:hypothetical protein
MLKKTASFVLASLGPSTYGKKYASAPRSLRPRWTAFLTILRDRLVVPVIAHSICCSRES